MTKRKRRILRLLVLALGALLSLYLAAPFALSPIVRNKLQRTVSDHLHARLDIGALSYHFPYSVTVRDASFAADEQHGNVELLRVKRLDLSLAKLPFGRGPIVVQNVVITEPVVHVVRDEQGNFIGAHLAKRDLESPPDWRRLKLSDFLRLRHFDLQRATFVYEDRAHPDAPPMEWRDLNARLQLQPSSASRYDLHFSADNEPIAKLNLTASADVDAWTIDVSKLAVSVHVNPTAQRSPLPAQIQEMLAMLGIEGTVHVEASGGVPLKDPSGMNFVVQTQLDHVRAAPEDRKWALEDLTASLRATVSDKVQLEVTRFDARGMGGRLQISQLAGKFEPQQKSWQIERLDGRIIADPASAPKPTAPTTGPTTSPSPMKLVLLAGTINFTASAAGSLQKGDRWPTSSNLVATFDKVALQPSRFPIPIENISGCARLVENNTVVVENADASYGPDQYHVAQARVSLADLPLRFEVTDIVARALAAQPGPLYPRPLTKTISVLRPNGPIDITGAFSIYRGRGRNEPDFSLTLIPRDGGLTLTKHDLRVSHLNGRIHVAPRLVTIDHVQGSLLCGTIIGDGYVIPRPPRYEDPERRIPVKYDGIVALQDIDLSSLCLAMNLIRDDGKPQASGRGAARVHTHGLIPAPATQPDEQSPTTQELAPQPKWLDEWVMHGSVRIDDADLWSGRVLSRIIGETTVAPDALTLSQAAALFGVADRRVELKQVAISSPAVGVQGSGVVGFDGSLNLNAIVAPLGDWRDGMQKTGLPIISDVAGEVVGAIQQLLNTATRQLLYQFRVEGNVKDPKISAVPAPMLTEGAAQLFESMLRGSKSDKLQEQIGGQREGEGSREAGRGGPAEPGSSTTQPR
jgi:hypothetical protein